MTRHFVSMDTATSSVSTRLVWRICECGEGTQAVAESIYWYCWSCDEKQLVRPEIDCSQCGEQMEPTDDSYLCDPCGREVRP